ncbi:MAG: TonB-dependent receptor [Proteobacteria bacterium]|nr:TonB-dependent receptor [Pseudomonadota bacterium]
MSHVALEKSVLKGGVALWVLAVASVAVGFGSPALAQDVAQIAPTSPPQPPSGPEKTYNLNIPSLPLGQGIAALSAQTGLQILAGGVASSPRQTPPIRGNYTVGQALSRMLEGTGVTYRFASASAITLEGTPTSGGTRAAPVAGGATTLPTLQVQGGSIAPGGDPYADSQAPYKADRLSSSKFSEPILDTPRSVTVLTKEALDDKNATTLREIARTTAGVTLGTGEGGNAFGDRFFIRGFDARNDIFVDGVRDPGVSIRETFNTEQVEILRGPASSFAGRGTTGGAINIVTKEASDQNFYRAEGTIGTDGTKRATADLNQVINDKVSVRLNALGQGAYVAGRNDTTDNRWGVALAVTAKPTDDFTIKADYSHTYLWGLPDFGVPYNQPAHLPVTETGVPRYTYYGITNRDFTQTTQDMGTVDLEWRANDWLTLENKFRASYSLLNYIGTIPENPSASGPTAPYASTPTHFSGYTQLNAQSRYEPVWVIADQPQATFKFNTGPVKNTTIVGAEFSRERVSIDTYTGLTSELTTGPAFFSSTGAPIVSVNNPTNYLYGLGSPSLTGNPLRYSVDTNAVYLIETANYNDFVFVNGGVRFDDYHITSANNTAYNAADFGIVSWNAGLTVKPLPNASVYVAYATAADPVGSELDATSSSYGGFSPTQNSAQIFGPQTSRAIEIGTKWEFFDRHLLATAAAFQTDVSNARETAPAGLPGYTSGQIVAGASYRVQGLDFEVAGKITPKWSVLGGLVLMNTWVTNSIVPTNIGLGLANIANQSFNMMTKYKVLDWLELGGQAVYRSQVLGGTLLAANGGVAYPNPPNPTVLPSYWRFDLFAEAKISDHASVKVYAQNIFDKTYYDSFYQSAQPFIMVAPGRSVFLVGTVKF